MIEYKGMVFNATQEEFDAIATPEVLDFLDSVALYPEEKRQQALIQLFRLRLIDELEERSADIDDSGIMAAVEKLKAAAEAEFDDSMQQP